MKKIVSVTILLMIFIMTSMLPVYAAGVAGATGSGGGSGTRAGTDSLDSVMKGAEDFLKEGSSGASTESNELRGTEATIEKKTGPDINTQALKETSNLIYNVLLGIALVVAVIVGMIIGIKFMVASVDEKAKIKEQLVPYVAGCIVVFGAFGIWKLVVTILATW